MKINTSNPALDAYQRMAITPVSTTRATQSASVADKPAPSNSDQQIAKISISTEARNLAVSSAQGLSDPEKVQRLRAALDSKELMLDSGKIAERMVRELG